MADTQDKLTAPYLPYQTLLTFVESLREHPLPQRIDKSLMSTLSGATQSQIMTCLRFLGLVSAQDAPLAALKALVDAKNPDEWAVAFAPVVKAGYKALLDGADLQTMTVAQLEELFRQHYGSQGESLEKAIRFFLKALTEAKISYSSRLAARQVKPVTKRTTNGNTNKKGNGDNSAGQADNTATPPPPTTPPGMITIPLYIPGKPAGSMTLPDDLDEDDCTMITAYITAYAARRKKAALEEKNE
jgi:hypothetical protein